MTNSCHGFQSTLPRRERRSPPNRMPSAVSSFNPRSHEGSDAGSGRLHILSAVSIHAPTKGATVKEGVAIYTQLFQSTLPRRERQSSTLYLMSCLRFNPRSHEGSDMAAGRNIKGITIVSIHAPTKGATRLDGVNAVFEQSFNPRSHEGSDFMHLTGYSGMDGFNPRSHEGSDGICSLSRVLM